MGVAERRAREKEELRQAILDAAGQLIIENGYENFSIRKIAEKIEYSPATIYLYFNDKAEILASICAEVFGQLMGRLSGIAAAEPDALEALRRGFRCYMEFGLEHPSHYMVTFASPWPTGVSRTPAIDAADQLGLECLGALRKAIELTVEQGRIPPGNTALQAQLAWTALHGLTAALICTAGDPHFPWEPRTELLRGMEDMVLRGLGAT